MIKPKVSSSTSIKVYSTFVTAEIPRSLMQCTMCKTKENIVGWESHISTVGVASFWFWCEDHKEAFESEIKAVSQVNEYTDTSGSGIKYLNGYGP